MTDFFSCQLCFCQKLWHFIVFCLFKVSSSFGEEGNNVTFSKYIVGFILRYFSLKRVKYFKWNYLSHRILIILSRYQLLQENHYQYVSVSLAFQITFYEYFMYLCYSKWSFTISICFQISVVKANLDGSLTRSIDYI